MVRTANRCYSELPTAKVRADETIERMGVMGEEARTDYSSQGLSQDGKESDRERVCARKHNKSACLAVKTKNSASLWFSKHSSRSALFIARFGVLRSDS